MLRNVKIRFAAVVVALAAVVFSVSLGGCGRKESREFTVGAIIPLSGKSATIGQYHQMGIDLAVAKLNEDGGVRGRRIVVKYEDSRNEAKDGMAAFQKLSSVDRVPVLIVTFSNVCAPIAASIRSDKRYEGPVFMATATSAPDLPKGSSWLFRCFITSDVESRELARFASRELKAKKAGIYYVNDDYGKGAADVFEKVFEKEYSGSIVYKEAHEIQQVDHRANVAKLKAAEADVLFVMGYGQSFGNALKQIRESGMTVPILSTATLALPDSLSSAGVAAEGCYLTTSMYDENSPDLVSLDFVKRFKAAYDKPTNYQSAATYLVTLMIGKAAENKGVQAAQIRQGLLEIQDFSSPLGNVTINAAREGSFPVKVMQIKNGQVTERK